MDYHGLKFPPVGKRPGGCTRRVQLVIRFFIIPSSTDCFCQAKLIISPIKHKIDTRREALIPTSTMGWILLADRDLAAGKSRVFLQPSMHI